MRSRWEDDTLQFARLLSELLAGRTVTLPWRMFTARIPGLTRRRLRSALWIS